MHNVKSLNMLVIIGVSLLFIFVACGKRKMEGLVVGGEYATIEKFPHSAYISISCVNKYGPTNSYCGASILNQAVSLTAAHCIEECIASVHIVISVGHVNKSRGVKSTIKYYTIHPSYDPVISKNDIALLKLRTPLTLGPKISRVYIMRNPPQTVGYVAGWGYVDDYRGIETDLLKYTTQPLMNRSDCLRLLRKMNEGTLCAGQVGGPSYTAPGDSGSALVVNDSIQIGIVSYKMPFFSRSVVIYTDTSYFYNWIKSNVHMMLRQE